MTHFANKKFPQTTSNASLCRVFKECYLEMMIIIILLKMRNPGFKIFIESGSSDGNHCSK